MSYDRMDCMGVWIIIGERVKYSEALKQSNGSYEAIVSIQNIMREEKEWKKYYGI